MTTPDTTANDGVIVVKRGAMTQDLVRSYIVLIDGAKVGKLWAFQTGRYSVSPGPHTVRLAINGAGTASSAEVALNVAAGETEALRTSPRSMASNLTLPLAIPDGIGALATGKPIESRFYKGPWIILTLDPSVVSSPPATDPPPAPGRDGKT